VFDAKGHYQYQINNLHRACAVYVDRANGGRIFVGELPSHLPVNAAVPNIGARVSVLTLKGDLLARVGGKFMGEGPGEFIAPHGIVMDSHGDFYVAEVAFTAKGRHENPPREIRSL
jgi:hypothetical protein